MEQYLNLLRLIKEKGTYKPAARENMPGTWSLFSKDTAIEFDLSKGFPALTTKKLFWKGIVTELLWFLRGDTNIKYLVDNGSHFWDEDAYNYYKKIAKANGDWNQNRILQPVSNKKGTRTPLPEDIDAYSMFTFEEFIEKIKSTSKEELPTWNGYTLGSCGHQYGKLWRDWEYIDNYGYEEGDQYPGTKSVDQVAEVINSLKTNPMGRRHIITAWNPATLDKMALNACHCLVQFNCRPLTHKQREEIWIQTQDEDIVEDYEQAVGATEDLLNYRDVPKYYLDCQMYQRSADVFLGVPFNIASYALLTHIFTKICNMIPGNFIHTFGDVHIYEDHLPLVEEQLKREPFPLAELITDGSNEEWEELRRTLDFSKWDYTDFNLKNYQSHPAIKAKLSTGLIK